MNSSIHPQLALWIIESPNGDQSSSYCILCKKVYDISTNGSPATISTLNPFIVKEQVIMAEIKWALKSISNQFSFRSCAGISDLFKSMFPDMCFDEALNKVAQRCQMDVLVRYFGPKGVQTRYLTSAFLRQTTAGDLPKSFVNALNFADKSKFLQISMDSPKVNWTFLSLFE
uniref:Uncharacterized protein n=1 Tax=Romanomermis culicivorax TaxID=13658 RepID=A0A915JCE8_ROMCU